jgi:alpha-galactosidase
MSHVRAGQEVFVKEITTAGFKVVGEEKFLKENYFVRFEKKDNAADGQDVRPSPKSHTQRDIEGWTVHIDDRLLAGADKALGDRALRLLANRLYDIKLVVPADKVAVLQKVPIWLDCSHGKLRPAQYHPSAGWLKSNGYSEALAKCVHIPVAADFASVNHQRTQPWSVLHELAHAYHDQVLGFDNAEIRAAWERFRDSGKYKSTLHINGSKSPHYALTNPMEFFAEMTEAYFGHNDFFPFNRAELQREEPAIYDLLTTIWHGPPKNDKTGSVKVFILAGQSNMEGKAKVSVLEYQIGQPATAELFKSLKKGGNWIERDDVWIKYFAEKGRLTIGYGSPKCIGPELGFGMVVGDHYKEPVLLIKTAWGGRSLYRDFRSPRAGLPPADVLDNMLADLKKRKPDATLDDVKSPFGASYRAMLDEVNGTLADMKKHFPDYAGQGYELAGFVWFQGWNDMVDAKATAEYTTNLTHFINDVRKDLKARALPFVVGEMGVGGKNAGANTERFRAAQAAVLEVPAFKGNVAVVKTDLYWDTEAEAIFKKGWRENLDTWNKVGSDYPFHYLGSPRTMYQIGRAFGDAMLELRAGE